MVKRRLYRLLRALLITDWPKYLRKTVEAINNSPNSAIGYLKPVDIKSSYDDPKIDKAVGFPKDVPVKEQKQRQKAYENDQSQLQVGDHVYLDFPPATMEKGFDTPVRFIPNNLVPPIAGEKFLEAV